MSIFSRLFRRSTPASPPPEPSEPAELTVPAPLPENEPAEQIKTVENEDAAKEEVVTAQEEAVAPLQNAGDNASDSVFEAVKIIREDRSSTPEAIAAANATATSAAIVSLSEASAPEPVLEPALEQNAEEAVEEAQPAQPKISWREKLKAGLKKTRDKLARNLRTLLRGRKLDASLLEELEELLLTADVGVAATQALLDDLQLRYKQAGDGADAHALLQESLIALLKPLEEPLDISSHNPYVIMLAGVNGAGKTTSIGKLARYFQQQGKTVLLAAGDTFRAAAREQLAAWGERNNVMVISQESADPAAVIYDAIQAAKARKIDVVLADTAGRLGTQLHLMEELKKIKRVVGKADETAPHEVLLVLDANTGQNALNQLTAFDEAIGVTGLVLTKLDGSAKGGVIAAIAKTQPRPIRFIGVGEGLDDLRPFEAEAFVQALFDDDDAAE